MASMHEEEKMNFLQAVVKSLVDIPQPLEDVNKDESELHTFKKEIEELKRLHKKMTKESESRVDSAKVKQESNSQSGDDMSSSLHFLIEPTSVLSPQLKDNRPD